MLAAVAPYAAPQQNSRAEVRTSGRGRRTQADEHALRGAQQRADTTGEPSSACCCNHPREHAPQPDHTPWCRRSADRR